MALSAPANQLIVEGAAGNQVSLAGEGWTLAGTTTLDGNSYNQYSSQKAGQCRTLPDFMGCFSHGKNPYR